MRDSGCYRGLQPVLKNASRLALPRRGLHGGFRGNGQDDARQHSPGDRHRRPRPPGAASTSPGLWHRSGCVRAPRPRAAEKVPAASLPSAGWRHGPRAPRFRNGGAPRTCTAPRPFRARIPRGDSITRLTSWPGSWSSWFSATSVTAPGEARGSGSHRGISRGFLPSAVRRLM